MRIPSHRKIEKQAEAYTNASFKVDEALSERLKILEERVEPLVQEWVKLRDAFCTGKPCRCTAHPRHNEFNEKIMTIQSEINEINRAIVIAKDSIFSSKKHELIRARLAKMAWIVQAER